MGKVFFLCRRTQSSLEIQPNKMDAIRQDLPPEGGYRPINFKRIPAQQLMRGRTLFAGFISLNGLAMYYYFAQARPRIIRLEVEKNSARLACLPLLCAEKDRAHLLQIRKNRDNEEKIMENIPGWEVGKWRGEKVFKTLGEEEWVDQTLTEFYGNSPSINRALRKLERQNPQRCVD